MSPPPLFTSKNRFPKIRLGGRRAKFEKSKLEKITKTEKPVKSGKIKQESSFLAKCLRPVSGETSVAKRIGTIPRRQARKMEEQEEQENQEDQEDQEDQKDQEDQEERREPEEQE
ncbi:hypothetical protein MMC22_011070 [Lobaria immixta]|nr:hypothetical protein [Lobaria immixta]